MTPAPPTLFTVLVPPRAQVDPLGVDEPDADRPTIPLACQLDRHPRPLSSGIVVLCHGMLDNRTKHPIAHLRETLPWDVVSFDFRGMGESGGDTAFANHGLEGDDVRAVVEHVEREFGRIICVVGHSKGAVAVQIWAARYPEQSSRIGRIVSLNPLYYNGAVPGSPPRPVRTVPYKFASFRRGPAGNRNEVVDFMVTEAGLDYRNQLDMGMVASRVPKDVAVLTVIGEVDDLTTYDRDAPLWRAGYGARDLTIVLLPGCGHYYKEPFERERCEQVVTEWLAERLRIRAGDVGGPAEAKL
ncbi:Alpha/Beta hydrolase protein [Hyaloraphidium curvatum]|nr:Alpha/Beta hydrolase protein [Hyaloraphidium curvatum]